MFVVPNPSPMSPANYRADANSRGRTAPAHASGRTSRGEDFSPGRSGSQENATPPAAAEIPPPAASASGVQRLAEAMSALGMSTAGLDISYSEEFVGYPGGAYWNKLITVTSGGKTEQFSAELTQKNPLVTAYELQQYFGVAATKNDTSGLIQQLG